MHPLGPLCRSPVAFSAFAPPPALCDAVEFLWTYESGGVTAEFVPPDLGCEIIWRTDTVSDAFIRGPQASGEEIAVPKARYTGARLKQGVTIFGYPSRQLCGRRVPIDRLNLDACDPLHSLAGALISVRKKRDPCPSLAARALDLIDRGEGTIRLGDLASALGCSTRHLRRMMIAELGMGPKTVSRIARLRKAIGLLSTSNDPLTHVALASGYGDQSHMNRDFASLMTPSPASLRRMSAFAKTH